MPPPGVPARPAEPAPPALGRCTPAHCHLHGQSAHCSYARMPPTNMGAPFSNGDPGIPRLSHGTPPGHLTSPFNSSLGTGRKFQTRLGNKPAQDCPALCATRPGPTLPACCPPTAAAWPWPPFSCWVGRALTHRVQRTAAAVERMGGGQSRVEAAALFLTKNGLRFSLAKRQPVSSFVNGGMDHFCHGMPLLQKCTLPICLYHPRNPIFYGSTYSSGCTPLADLTGKCLNYHMIRCLGRTQ